jgi:elongation factor 2 kinase
MNATKYTYDCAADKWDEARVKVRIAPHPFAEGGMRLAYRAWEVVDDDEIPMVVKRWKRGGSTETVVFDEARTQMVAEHYAQEFNRRCADKGIDGVSVAFLPASALRVDGITEVLSLEPYLEGEYVKQSDNCGGCSDNVVAAAFSYFTFVTSFEQLVVVDIQGVGTFYTDPQIHTWDGSGFGAGNRGAKGLKGFLRSHKHTSLCDALDLPRHHAPTSSPLDAAFSRFLIGHGIAPGFEVPLSDPVSPLSPPGLSR